jgi:hypothetical protein
MCRSEIWVINKPLQLLEIDRQIDDVNLMGMLHLHVTRQGLIHQCHAGGAGNEICVQDHGSLQNKSATRIKAAQNTNVSQLEEPSECLQFEELEKTAQWNMIYARKVLHQLQQNDG